MIWKCLIDNLELILSWLLKVAAFVVLYLSPISSFVHIVLILVLIDNITGIWASVKNGEPFTANKLRKTITKFILYSVAIITGYLLQSLVNDGTAIAKYVAFAIGSVEVVSIYENIARITGLNVFKQLAEYLQNISKSKLNDNNSNSSATEDFPKSL